MSGTVGIFQARPVTVRAMRVLLGITTRSEITAFCPGANIGRISTDETDLDIRWLQVPGGGEVQNDGDWIVKNPDGTFAVYSDKEFNERYVSA